MTGYDGVGEGFLSLLEQENLSARDVAALGEALPDCDGELRQRIAESLINAGPADARPLLQRLAGDGEWLVRAEACQSLGAGDDPGAENLLLDRARNDPEELVRVYAVHALGEILGRRPPEGRGRILEALQTLEGAERSPRLRLALCEALYRANPAEDCLTEIVRALESPDYTLRCSALNSLAELLSPENREVIRRAVLRLKKTEPTRAVQSTIARLERQWESLGT